MALFNRLGNTTGPTKILIVDENNEIVEAKQFYSRTGGFVDNEVEIKRSPGRPAVLDMNEIQRVWNDSANVILAANTLGMSQTQLHSAVYRGRKAGMEFKEFRRPKRSR